MNNDLISRSKVIEELNYLKYIGYDNSGVMKLQNIEIQRCISVIEDAPTVELFCSYLSDGEVRQPCVEAPCKDERPQGEWIPISERLPEYSGLYLISVDDLVTVANFTGNYFMNRVGGRVEVNAWQPLPEPYKKGGAV